MWALSKRPQAISEDAPPPSRQPRYRRSPAEEAAPLEKRRSPVSHLRCARTPRSYVNNFAATTPHPLPILEWPKQTGLAGWRARRTRGVPTFLYTNGLLWRSATDRVDKGAKHQLSSFASSSFGRQICQSAPRRPLHPRHPPPPPATTLRRRKDPRTRSEHKGATKLIHLQAALNHPNRLTSPEALLESVESGAVMAIKGSYLVSLAKKAELAPAGTPEGTFRVGRRPQLPADAVWTPRIFEST